MTATFDALLQQALAGTHRVEAPRAGDDPKALLDGIAWAAQYRLLGRPLTAYHLTPDDPAPAETRPVCPPAVVSHLQTLLAAGWEPELKELLHRLGALGLRLPPTLLPVLLKAAARGPKGEALGHALLPTLGQRGLWLCRLYPPWAFMAIEPGDVGGFAAASPKQRRWLLAHWRRVDRAAARRAMAAAWSTATVAERLAWLEMVAANIGGDDIPWLLTLKDDKSAQVRGCVVRLLLPQLPALQDEALHRATALVTLKEISARRLVVTPPKDRKSGWAFGVSPPGRNDDPILWLIPWLSLVAPSRLAANLGLALPEWLVLLRASSPGVPLEGLLDSGALLTGDRAYLTQRLSAAPPGGVWSLFPRLGPQLDDPAGWFGQWLQGTGAQALSHPGQLLPCLAALAPCPLPLLEVLFHRVLTPFLRGARGRGYGHQLAPLAVHLPLSPAVAVTACCGVAEPSTTAPLLQRYQTRLAYWEALA
ncbi:MAG: DUF5691 domain-containing protein [Candidatus Competibacterales bacterium]